MSRDSKAPEKAILISGPPGIGKTTSAHMACKQLNLDTVEMNASDTRSKASLQEHVRDIIDNRSLSKFSEFFSKVLGSGMFDKQENGNKPTRGDQMQVLIMDEVDGMSSGDRGGMMELIQIIKKTKVIISHLLTVHTRCPSFVFATTEAVPK